MRQKVIEESLLRDGLVIRNEDGLVTHRIERSAYGEQLLYNVRTHRTEVITNLF